MAVDFSMRNQDGSIIFSNNALNPCARASGAAVAVSYGGLLSLREFTISYTPVGSLPPLCAIRPTAGGVMLFSQGFSGGQWHWSFLTTLAAGSTLDYWIFDEPAPVTSGVVIEIREDITNRLLWAMGNWPLRVIPPFISGDMLVHNDITQPNAVVQDFTLGAGRTYAVIVADPALYQKHVYLGAGTYTFSTIGESVQVIDNVIRCRNIWISRESGTTTDPVPTWDRFLLNRTIVPVDITNY